MSEWLTRVAAFEASGEAVEGKGDVAEVGVVGDVGGEPGRGAEGAGLAGGGEFDFGDGEAAEGAVVAVEFDGEIAVGDVVAGFFQALIFGEGPELGEVVFGEGEFDFGAGALGAFGGVLDGEEVFIAAAAGDLAEAGLGAVGGEDEVALADEVVGVFGEVGGGGGDEELALSLGVAGHGWGAV
jgi:hypothetical protein